ncbi:DUF4402 domain-containing protein [Novosphingobium sp. NPDC080210]|uniref:DUF4402 domain-containing protein n=1 Tax=Novosphingobium sp. NPDC080210 TaxID=3390596 RepID=UPI003D032489
MKRSLALGLGALLLAALPAQAQEACRLCYSEGQPGERPLTLEIWTGLSFARLALLSRSGGSAEVDAQTGGKTTQGDLISLGGAPVTGRGKVTGIPLRQVRIDLPARVPMTTPDGASAELVDFTTNLPHRPTLDANGELEFTFGARLVVRDGRGGNYRGRIPITVDYN